MPVDGGDGAKIRLVRGGGPEHAAFDQRIPVVHHMPIGTQHREVGLALVPGGANHALPDLADAEAVFCANRQLGRQVIDRIGREDVGLLGGACRRAIDTHLVLARVVVEIGVFDQRIQLVACGGAIGETNGAFGIFAVADGGGVGRI